MPGSPVFPFGRACALALIVGACAAPPAAAQQPLKGLDVPFVPSSQATVEAMLRVANVGPHDFVIDLGSGDGRILITAAKKHGARGFGVDLDPQRVEESIENARAAGVTDRVHFLQRNLFDTNITDATVVTMYLLPRVNLDLKPRLLKKLKPGTRVVSHNFDMGDWKADLKARVRGESSEIFLWIVPAKVAGRWQMHFAIPGGGQFAEIEFRQKYQEIEGIIRRASRPLTVRDARLEGERIAFTLVSDTDFMYRQRVEGAVDGNTMMGTVRGEGTAPRGRHGWHAVKGP